jgi:uncharacterized lipoprotein YbaY
VSPSASPSEAASASAPPSPTPEPTTGVIRGTLTYKEDHELSAGARALVALIEAGTGERAGTTMASTVIEDPGPKPVAFELSYPLASVSADTSYQLVAGIADGDLAWVTPIGVVVNVPQPLIEDVVLPLEYRPDLLKGAVTGTMNGVGLDPSVHPDSYGTVLLTRADNGESVGFQYVPTVSTIPAPFSVPFDPRQVDQAVDYVVHGTIWDGSTLWASDTVVPVITKGNRWRASSCRPVPTASPTPAPTATPVPSGAGTAGSGADPLSVLVLVVLLGGAGTALVLFLRRRQA